MPGQLGLVDVAFGRGAVVVGELPGPFIRGQFRQSSHFAMAFPRHGQPANAVSTRCSRPLCRRGWAGRVARASCPGPVFRRRRSHDGDPGGRTALPTFFLDIPWSVSSVGSASCHYLLSKIYFWLVDVFAPCKLATLSTQVMLVFRNYPGRSVTYLLVSAAVCRTCRCLSFPSAAVHRRAVVILARCPGGILGLGS